MNNEIEEILDYISDRIIKKEKWNKVRDYITNLQQENNNLKTSLDESQEVVIDLQQEKEHLDKVNCHLRKKINNDIYKSRIEKTIEYIENNDFGIITFSDRDINGNLVTKIEKGYVKKDELLNILNGRSDE